MMTHSYPTCSTSISLVLLAGLFFFVSGCAQQNAVTIYTSVDQDYAQPIIQEFQDRNPEIVVNAVYDSELTKTTGLYTRLRNESRNPQADVFWNSEILRTIQLKQQGLLEPYFSPSAENIPDSFKDPEGYWTGFSARARVMIVNNDRFPPARETQVAVPDSIERLYNSDSSIKTGIARPEFGTTATHMAVLATQVEPSTILARLRFAINNRNLSVLPGNSMVRDQVAAGQLWWGLTDTDDAFAAMDEGKPVRIHYLNQDGDGTLLIPNTVALMKGSPNPANGKLLIDFLLSEEIEEMLSETRARQIPVRDTVPRPEGVPNLATIKVMEADFEQAAEELEATLEVLGAL